MYPEDRVLVGVIRRKKDLGHALNQGWYRLPLAQMPGGVPYDILALYTGRRITQDQPGGIYTFARISGLELARRRDLLPDEADHARADEVYYRLALRSVQDRTPPILNPTGLRFAFIRTTWDRFVLAQTVRDLTFEAPYLVPRSGD